MNITGEGLSHAHITLPLVWVLCLVSYSLSLTVAFISKLNEYSKETDKYQQEIIKYFRRGK